MSRRLLPSLISSTLTGDAFPASRALDAARRETLDPAVLRAARLVLGDAAYRAKIQPAVIACLTPTGSEASKEASKEALNPDPDVPSVSDSDPDVSSVSSAAAAALAATVADAGSLPAALRDVVRPLVAALGDGPGVIDAIARVNAVLDAPAVVRHVLPALERLVGPVDAHLPGCGARNPSEDGHSRATAAEHRGERDAVDDAVGSDDARGVDASYASSEATAVREGWSRAPSSARAFAPSAAPLASETRALAALAALEATIREVSPRVVGDRVFPRAPRPPGPLLSLLLLPTPSLPTLLAAADVVVTAAKRVGAKRAVETAARRLGPLFAFAAEDVKNEPRDGIVRIVRRSAGGARGGSRAVPRPRGRVRFPRASRRHARVGGDRGETRKMVRVGPVARRARFPTPGGANGRHARDDGADDGSVPGNIFHRDGVENRTGNERYVARGFGGGERRVAGTDARRLARGAPRASVSDLRRVARKLRGGGGRDGDSEKSSRKHASVGLTDADADAHADAHDVEPRGGGSYSHDAAYRADAPWAWLPSAADDLRVDGAEDEPWALRLETLTSWRAHPRWLRAVAVSADEASVLTVGGAGVSAGAGASARGCRSGRGSGVVLGRPRGGGGGGGLGAIASHEAHAHAPTCAAFVPGNRTGCGAALVASADAGGALHVWRADTGETIAKLREPAASRTRAGFGFGVGRATPRDAARLTGAHVNANADTTTGASTFTRRLSDASPPGIRSGSPGAETPRATSTETPPPSSSSDLPSSNFPSRTLGFATLDAEYHARGVAVVAVGGGEDVFLGRRRSDSNVVDAALGVSLVARRGVRVRGVRARAGERGNARAGHVRRSRSFRGRGRRKIARRVGRRAGSRRDGSRRLFPRGRGRGRGRGRDGIGTRSMAGSGSSPGSVGWTCAGTSRGFVGLLDRRDGHLVSGFFAHDGAVTAAAASADGTRFVTAGADRTVACWDARALASSVGGGHKRALTASFGGFKDPVAGLALRGEDAFAVAGGRLGVFSPRRNTRPDRPRSARRVGVPADVFAVREGTRGREDAGVDRGETRSRRAASNTNRRGREREGADERRRPPSAEQTLRRRHGRRRRQDVSMRNVKMCR